MNKRNTNADAGSQSEAPTGQTDDQILHRANFESESELKIVPPPVEPSEDKTPVDAEASDVERKIGELLDQIGEGLRADDTTSFEKLNIARKYGPAVVDLKALTEHGQYMNKLKERFPKTKYPTLNRWSVIARNEIEVASAIEKYPEVAWGPKKMINYLNGWNPEEEQEAHEEDEEDVAEFPAENNLNQELLLYDDKAKDSPKSNPQNKAVTQTEDTPNSPKLKEVKSAKPKVVGEYSERNTSANKQSNDLKAKEESVIAEVADSAVNKLNALTKQLVALHEQMERLDWHKESTEEWDDAIVRLKTISVKLTDKAMKVINSRGPKKAGGQSPKRSTKAKN